MRIMDYQMFTYVVRYTYRARVYDELGETTGQMVDTPTEFNTKVVARSQEVADAWIRQRHDGRHSGHTRFTFAMLKAEEAPNLLIEYTG